MLRLPKIYGYTMGPIVNRAIVVSSYLSEVFQHGFARSGDACENEVVIALDGVGGFQFGPLLIRRAFRQDGQPIGTLYFRWQGGMVGEVLSDLMRYRRNRLMGIQLARKILAFARRHPDTRLHLVAYSGGAGIAAFACEKLKGRRLIETLVLACPALSPEYNLGPALQSVTRCYALTSRKDFVLLGLGTRLFGTTDRQFTAAAGKVGFRIPSDASPEDRSAYDKMRQINWTPGLKRYRHHGGHSGWVMIPLLRAHLVPILHGQPLLPAHPIPSA